MRILFQSYELCMQNDEGGINVRMKALYSHLLNMGVDIHFYNKFTHKISDFDIIHIFKANIDNNAMLQYAHSIGKKTVISSVVPCAEKRKIQMNLMLCKLLPVTTGIQLLKDSLDTTDLIIAETPLEKEFLKNTYNIQKDKIDVIPNGVNKIFYQEGTDDLIYKYLPHKYDYVLCVGRFDPNKNQLSLIRSLKGSGIPLVFIGGACNGHEKYYEACLAEADKDVTFLGWLAHSDPALISAYKNAKVFVAPSIYETFGISIIEAACCGCNIALSNTLPILHYMNLNKYTFSPKKKSDMKNAILQAFYDKKDISNRESIKKQFDWSIIAKQHYDLYESLIRK